MASNVNATPQFEVGECRTVAVQWTHTEEATCALRYNNGVLEQSFIVMRSDRGGCKYEWRAVPEAVKENGADG